MQQRFKGVNGEILPDTQIPNWLQVEHVLQVYRDVWVLTNTYPFLSVDTARVEMHCNSTREFTVFANGRLMQNIRPDEGLSRLLNVFIGGSIDAGISPDAEVIVEGMANPRAHWMMYLNDPFYIGMHPFAAFGTSYIHVNSAGIYQRTFAELVIIDTQSRPHSAYVDFDPLAEMLGTFHDDYINGSRSDLHSMDSLSSLIDAIFVENRKIHAAAAQHHRDRASLEKPFDYTAPTLTRYGRLTHDAIGLPCIEISFSLVHYEKALREFQDLKEAMQKRNTEAAFFHGVYCVVAVAACAEAIGNRLVFQQKKSHPDYRDKRTPIKKINEAATELAKIAGRTFIPLAAGTPPYDALEKIRKLRNSFMHANELGEQVDPVALTSAVFTEVDEIRCRDYLRNLRMAAAHVYDQLSPEYTAPIVTRENVKWLTDLEVP